MGRSRETVLLHLVVRRVGWGATPFRWEVFGGESSTPLFVSPEGFASMAAAHAAGQARLPEFVPSRWRGLGVSPAAAGDDSGRTAPNGNRAWRSRAAAGAVQDQPVGSFSAAAAGAATMID